MSNIENSEEWKPVAGIDGYLVSNLGRIRSIKPRKGARSQVNDGLLTGWIQTVRNGYKRQLIAFRVDGKTIIKRVHHVVLEAFIGPRQQNHEALHGNGDALDNRLDNLRWGTHHENVKDCIVHGTKTNPPVHAGMAHHNATLSTEQVEEIRRTEFKRGTQAALARQFGVAPITIQRIQKGLSRANG